MNYTRPTLALLLLACGCARAAERESATQPYDRHVVFEHAPYAQTYWESEASCTIPSTLEIVNGRLPVDPDHWKVPKGSLRLAWTSSPGGDWQAELKARSLYTLKNDFDGDTLSLWVYSEKGMSESEAPWIHLEDENLNGTFTVSLLAGQGPVPPGAWFNVRLPLTSFRATYQGTDEDRFELRRLAKVVFQQGLDDGKAHTLLVDDVQVVRSGVTPGAPPPAPEGLSVTAAERHFDLRWNVDPSRPALRFTIFRSRDGKQYEPVGTQAGGVGRFVDFVGAPPQTAYYRVAATAPDGAESQPSASASGTTRAFNDNELMDMVQEGCFRYYWENGHPIAGMALEVTPGDPNLVALGASGFGIMAIVAGADRGFVTRQQAAERLLKIVRFLDKADRFHGVWPHFLDGRTGKTRPFFGPYDDGGDLVETSFLMQGLLTARSYFHGDNAQEREIRQTITRLWEGVEFDWYRREPNSDFLYWHWSPDHGWHIGHPLIGWNETMIVYLLAIASPTHPAPASLYYSGWAGQSDKAVYYRHGWSHATYGDHYANGHDYYGIHLDVGEGTGGNLFFTQFSFLGFDPRGKKDRYTDYFVNNRSLALINRAYCVENPLHFAGYGPDCWGLSAGINSGGGMPEPAADNGTICTSASLGEFPYTPVESLAALKHFYRDLGPKTWGIYGFHDGFNPSQDWYEPVWMGLNQAQIVVMIENFRSGLAWRMFMQNPEIPKALDAIGFKDDHATQP